MPNGMRIMIINKKMLDREKHEAKRLSELKWSSGSFRHGSSNNCLMKAPVRMSKYWEDSASVIPVLIHVPIVMLLANKSEKINICIGYGKYLTSHGRRSSPTQCVHYKYKPKNPYAPLNKKLYIRKKLNRIKYRPLFIMKTLYPTSETVVSLYPTYVFLTMNSLK